MYNIGQVLRKPFFTLALLLFSCQKTPSTEKLFVDGFDFPVNPPNAQGFYDAQPFGTNNHLGNDWNGVRGGNSDLGEPVHCIAHGTVSFVEEVGGGWGKVVRITHTIKEGSTIHQVESLYAHFDKVYVHTGQIVKRGEKIGTIGTANGKYQAHLHLEIRNTPGLSLGNGYSHNKTNYIDPTQFIVTHRPTEQEMNRQ